MSKRAYSVIVGLFLCFALAFQRGRTPFGNDFIRIFVPCLLVLNSLHWFVLPKKVVWKAAGFCTSLAVFSLIHFSFIRSQGNDFANFATFLFLFVVAQYLAFWAVTPDNSIRTVSGATNLATLFIILLGVFMNTHGAITPRFSEARLLISPLAALLMTAMSDAYKWNAWIQVTLVCTIVQIGIGLFDIGADNNLRWMVVCSVLVICAALGLAAFWAKDLNKLLSPD
jgi:hypothetical protein